MDLSALWAKLQAMLNWAVALLPNLVLGALVFVLFLFAGKGALRGLTPGDPAEHGP